MLSGLQQMQFSGCSIQVCPIMLHEVQKTAEVAACEQT